MLLTILRLSESNAGILLRATRSWTDIGDLCESESFGECFHSHRGILLTSNRRNAQDNHRTYLQPSSSSRYSSRRNPCSQAAYFQRLNIALRGYAPQRTFITAPIPSRSRHFTRRTLSASPQTTYNNSPHLQRTGTHHTSS